MVLCSVECSPPNGGETKGGHRRLAQGPNNYQISFENYEVNSFWASSKPKMMP